MVKFRGRFQRLTPGLVYPMNKSTTSGENLVERGCESLWMKRFDALPNE
jgi:hypothetical protein